MVIVLVGGFLLTVGFSLAPLYINNYTVRATVQALQNEPELGRKSTQEIRMAVERKFEVIGEALNQLAKLDAAMAARIPDVPQVVAFRNQLIHGYATVNPDTVWNIAQNALPGLLAAVQGLLDDLGP